VGVGCHSVGENVRGKAVLVVYVPDRARVMFTVKEGAVNMMPKEQSRHL
jgi:hypothetical protein